MSQNQASPVTHQQSQTLRETQRSNPKDGISPTSLNRSDLPWDSQDNVSTLLTLRYQYPTETVNTAG